MENKKRIWYSSRFWILLYAVALFLTMSFQLFVDLCDLNHLPFELKFIRQEYINGEARLPLETLSWFWLAIVSLFCGFDRAVDIRETMQLKSGQMSMGDLGKLRGIILISLLLFLYSVFCSLLAKTDFQMAQLASTFGMCTLIYVSGNKAVKMFKYSHLEDKDDDGIPDEYQDKYYKWARQARKEGVDAQFITFDYFMDSIEE